MKRAVRVLRIADQEVDAARRRRAAPSALDATAESAMEQQSRADSPKREFGRDYVAAPSRRASSADARSFGGVARHIADGGIDLSQRYPHAYRRLVKGVSSLFLRSFGKRDATL